MGKVNDAQAGIVDAPAEVDVFEAPEVAFVEVADAGDGGGGGEDAGPRDPIGVGDAVVVPV